MTKAFYSVAYNQIWSLAQGITHGQEQVILNQLEKSQYFSAEKLQELQFARLSALLHYAYQNVPFYTQRFQKLGITPNDIKTIQDFHKIPVLTRKDLQDNVASLQSTELRPGKSINYTGGSTGSPVAFYQDQVFHDYYKALVIRLRQWYGFDRGDKVAYLWGAERDIPQWSFAQRLQILLKRQKWLNAFKMTEERIQEFIHGLQMWRPSFIIGYASALHTVAQYMIRNGITDIYPLAIESSAEKLWDYQRVDIERAFNAPVVDVYGSREISPIAAQCIECNGLHVMAESRLVEIIDDDGVPIKNGKVGNMVITDLSNYSMPFIRYVNGDMASWLDESCVCGRTLPMLKEVQGRSSDLIRTKSGTMIHGEFFTHLFYGKPVAQFQVRQIALDKIVILVRPAAGFSENLFLEFKYKIDDFSHSELETEFRIVDEIPLTTTGKYRFTISELPKANQ